MRVFLLGGAGMVGQATAKRLAANAAVSEITIAGRDPEKAKRAASAIGEKANSVKAEATDEKQMARLVRGYDLFVNTSGPDYVVQLPVVRAAIRAGVSYCDVSCDGPAAEKVLKLNTKARAAGMTAIIGIGWAPGIDNLMMTHAVSQLDKTESVHACLVWPLTDLVKGDTKKVAENLRRNAQYSASWETGMRCFSGECKIYRGGKWMIVDPFESGVDVSHPRLGTFEAYPACGAESVTLPRHVRGVKDVSVLLSFYPPQMNELARRLAVQIKAGRMTTKEAALSFIETAGSDRERWLSTTKELPEVWPYLVIAKGVKNGHLVRYTLDANTDWLTTDGPLYTAGMMLLKGRIKEHGIFPPEACLDPIPFLEEVALSEPGWTKEKMLFEEKLERLE